jgi:hypothetical protein
MTQISCNFITQGKIRTIYLPGGGGLDGGPSRRFEEKLRGFGDSTRGLANLARGLADWEHRLVDLEPRFGGLCQANIPKTR